MTEPGARVRCLTPPGSGAIAVLELSGRGAWSILTGLFRPRLSAVPATGQLHFGLLGPPPGDEVVITVRATDPQVIVEVQCHGGVEIVRWLIDAFTRAGAVPESPRVDDIGRLLAQAPSLRSASILLDQEHGAFNRYCRQIEQALRAGRLDEARQRTADMLRFADLGRHLVIPWRVVVAGAPNVGKSSLVNAIAGFQRCVVTPIAGTTRDVVSARLVIDGWPVELLDTAGIRDADDALEAAGVERSTAALRGANLCLWVVETTARPIWPPADVADPVLVINKIERPMTWNSDRANLLAVSADTGAGLDRLLAAISARLVPIGPESGDGVPVNPAQVTVLQSVSDLLAFDRREDAVAVLAKVSNVPPVLTAP